MRFVSGLITISFLLSGATCAPAIIADKTTACPRQLEITGSDAGLKNSRGVYTMIEEKRRGWPVWSNANKDRYIFVSSDRSDWHITTSEHYNKDDDYRLASASFNENCPMNLAYKVWNDRWVENTTFNVIAACPRQLEVTGADAELNNNKGVYTMTGERRRGYPVWINENLDRWIFVSINNYWHLSKTYKEDNKKSFAYASFDHNCPTDLAYKVWNNEWIQQPSFDVIAVCPRQLEVTGSDAQVNNNEGVYTMTGEKRRGWPVWINENKDRWIFVSINNYWHLSKTYKEDNKKSFAYASFDHHCPTNLAYKVWVNDNWLKEASFDVIEVCPRQIEVTGFDAERENLEGVYIMTGEERRGWPVWYNKNMDRYMFVSSNSFWVISSPQRYKEDSNNCYAYAPFSDNCPLNLPYKVWLHIEEEWILSPQFNVITE